MGPDANKRRGNQRRIDVEVARPDVDLTDGTFYAGHSHTAYQWMCTHQPVFRDRNGLAGAASYRAVLDAERNPELFSSAGGIRPNHVPPIPQMIDMDDPDVGGANSSTPDLRLATDDALPLGPANLVSGLDSVPVLHTDQTTWRKHMFSEELTTNGDQRHRPTARR